MKKTIQYYNKGELTKTMDFNIEALEKYKKLNNKEGIIITYTNVASLPFSVNNLKENLRYLDVAKEEMDK